MWLYTALTFSFPYLEPVCCSMSSSNYCFLTSYRFLNRQVSWSGIPICLSIFQFVVIRTVKIFPGGSVGKNICLECGRPGFNPWVGKMPWRRKWQPTPVFLPGKIPWTEEPGRRQSMGSQRVTHDWMTSLYTVKGFGIVTAQVTTISLPLYEIGCWNRCV